MNLSVGLITHNEGKKLPRTLNAAEAMEFLRDRMQHTQSNEEFLASMNK
jgi:transcription termination factor Rho